MKRAFIAAAMLLVTPPLMAQAPPPQVTPAGTTWDSARFAWEAGRYPEALSALTALLAQAPGDGLVRAVALLTGEYFVTREVAADGRRIGWSPDGRWAAFESGTGTERRTTVIGMSETDGRRSVVVPGSGAAFSPGGEIAYIAASGGVRVRDPGSRRERTITMPDGLSPAALAWGPDGRTLLVTGTPQGGAEPLLYRVSNDVAVPLDTTRGAKRSVQAVPATGSIVYTSGPRVVVRNLASGEVRAFSGAAPAVSADGSTIAWIAREGATSRLMVGPAAGGEARAVITTDSAIAAPALSPSGRRVVWQMMPREDWDLYVAETAAGPPRRLTYDIQHDILPRFAGEDRVLGVIGEARHRRSHMYDVASGSRTRLFHNNTIRTVAPEYEWAVSPDGTKVLIVAERDGDTISPERGVYLVDLTQPVTTADVRERLAAMTAHESGLRARGEAMYRPIAAAVRAAVDEVSVDRIYDYERALYRLDTKYIGTPGNLAAIEYLTATLRTFGYDAEVQWFAAEGHRTANVVAKLEGTANPELVYVVSSHFDSVEEGPGADDNSSGTAALLEAARVLATRPQTATIQFAWFTGEEAGLYGSREFVRRAVADSVQLVGALNNDMIGFANDQRLDNTIRYSNDGIRDLQHAAAFLFGDLITYDARYYKNTDAHAYYEEYGDIVGGIGSYPILGNPHYHRSHDVLETIDHRLVAAVSRTTVASLMAMASRPSRVSGLVAERRGGGADVRWRAAPEQDVSGYVVSWGQVSGEESGRMQVTEPRARIPALQAGTEVRVKAVTTEGVEGWDWARAIMK